MTDGGQRAATDKTCPVVLRSPQGKCEILEFCHPLAGGISLSKAQLRPVKPPQQQPCANYTKKPV